LFGVNAADLSDPNAIHRNSMPRMALEESPEGKNLLA
jgi:hypothetical protein